MIPVVNTLLRIASLAFLGSSTALAAPPLPGSPSAVAPPAPSAPPGMYIDPPQGAPALGTPGSTVPAKPSANKPTTGTVESQTAGSTPTQHLVVISQAGKDIAVGIILDRDGRILTGLRTKGRDALASADVQVRYADGGKSRGKVMHEDEVTGLALVVPQDDVRRTGIRASEASSFKTLTHLSQAMEGTQMTLALFKPEDASLQNQVAIPTNAKIQLRNGSSFMDLSGAVAGIVTPLCGSASSGAKEQVVHCMYLGMVSVSAIRSFLSKTPKEAVPPPPWLGIAVDVEARGLRVTAVAPESPAASAGLKGAAPKKPGDVILAVDGKTVSTADELAKAIAAHVPGEKLQLALVPEGTKTEARVLTVVLRPAP
jgi:putative serine protease PepD